MVQLRVLSGRSAGSTVEVDRFPCLLGRGAKAVLRFEEPGVWEQHLQIEFKPQEGIRIAVLPGARAVLNGHAVEHAALRNGDVIEAGSVKLQFWLSPPHQRSLRLREIVTWVSLVLLCAGQIALVYQLLR
jgi:hypothetical protein